MTILWNVFEKYNLFLLFWVINKYAREESIALHRDVLPVERWLFSILIVWLYIMHPNPELNKVKKFVHA